MAEVIRADNVELFDRLLKLRRFDELLATAIESLERATFEQHKAH
jgi:hypothetical protein